MKSQADTPEARHMRRALALARRGLGRVEPNPMVGCVLVRGGRVIGEGFHRKFGGPHAEVEALADAQRRGEPVEGCDVYVSLEPCSHHGKTPPCADALIAARVGRVFAAMADPFPKVAGGGIARLRDAGVQVDVGMLEDEARELNEPFTKRVTTGLPWVIVKWAQTLDGKTATARGDSKWISNEASRKFVHQLRARVDAVIVGVSTVVADDPQLTARGVPRRRKARRVVIDPDLRIPHQAKLLGDLESAPVTIATSERLLEKRGESVLALEERGVELIGLPPSNTGTGRLALRPLLVHLADRHQATNVLVEGGATLSGHLFTQGLVDQVLAFVAPKLLCDDTGVPAVRGLACESIAKARGLRLRDVKRFGDDVMLDYRARE